MTITQFEVVSRQKKVLGNPSGLIESSDDIHHVVPLLSLNPYKYNWTAIVRVSSKSPLRPWKNERGEGKVFNMDLVDSTVSCIVNYCLM